MKKIINADQMTVIGYFDSDEEKAKLEELESQGWVEPSVDRDGDIIVWEPD